MQSFELLNHLVTPSLITSTWQFLSHHNLHIITDLKVNLPRQDDCYLLPALQAVISDPDHLLWVNRCRIYLRALFLSDIVDGAGLEHSLQLGMANTLYALIDYIAGPIKHARLKRRGYSGKNISRTHL